ncbi:MAG: PAS domain-containing sensor histidine kinase [Balneola sp.]|nr:PAS domain-containing sensor histidine kinase [Balneola sp.]
MNNESAEYSLRPFFDLSSDLFCVAGFDGYLKRINPALCKVLGYTEEEFLSRPINTFIHPDDVGITEKKREHLYEGKKLVNFENRYITKNGDVLWLSWAAKSVKEKELVYAIARDITHKKTHEDERNRLLSELTKSNKHLKQLRFSTTHDLRSPLNSILSIFSLMDIETIEDEETREFVELLEKASKNIKSKLDEYVDHQKKENLEPVIAEINLPEVLQNIFISIDSLIKETETEFNIDLSAFDTVPFSKIYLESVFLNLISNSIKYAHPNRNPVITIKSVEESGQKKLIFSDNGIGFDSKKNKNRLFKFNQSFHDHADSKGIGLYLVYNHITSLGGSISVKSEENKGTTFTLTFP